MRQVSVSTAAQINETYVVHEVGTRSLGGVGGRNPDGRIDHHQTAIWFPACSGDLGNFRESQCTHSLVRGDVTSTLHKDERGILRERRPKRDGRLVQKRG